MSRHLMLTLVAGGLAALGSAAAGARSPAYALQGSITCASGRAVCYVESKTNQVCTLALPNIQGTWTCLRWKTVTTMKTYYYPPQPSVPDSGRGTSDTTYGSGGGSGGASQPGTNNCKLFPFSAACQVPNHTQ